MSFVFARWPAPRGVFAGYTESKMRSLDIPRREINISFSLGEQAAALKQSRDLLRQRVGLRNIQWIRQVHGNQVLESSSFTVDDQPEADGIWTKEIGSSLAVTTADCVPVVLTDSLGSFVSISHFGWRGAFNGLIDSLFDSIPGARGLGYVAWIGPSICGKCYEVGADVVNQLDKLNKVKFCRLKDVLRDPNAETQDDEARCFFDLPGYIEHLLIRRRVVVSRSNRCTMHEKGLYSYRRDQNGLRFATLVWHV